MAVNWISDKTVYTQREMRGQFPLAWILYERVQHPLRDRGVACGRVIAVIADDSHKGREFALVLDTLKERNGRQLSFGIVRGLVATEGGARAARNGRVHMPRSRGHSYGRDIE